MTLSLQTTNSNKHELRTVASESNRVDRAIDNVDLYCTTEWCRIWNRWIVERCVNVLRTLRSWHRPNWWWITDDKTPCVWWWYEIEKRMFTYCQLCCSQLQPVLHDPASIVLSHIIIHVIHDCNILQASGCKKPNWFWIEYDCCRGTSSHCPIFILRSPCGRK